MKKILFLILLTLLIPAPAFADFQPWSLMPQIEDVTITNPTPQQAVIDARQAAKTKDFRFMMVYAQKMECPGVDMDARVFSIMQKYGVKGVRGTDVTFDNDAAKQLNDSLIVYARKYNITLLAAYRAQTE